MLETKNFTIEYDGEYSNSEQEGIADCWNQYTIKFKKFDCSPIKILVEDFQIVSSLVENQKGRPPEDVNKDYNMFSLIENDVVECIKFMHKFEAYL